MRLVSTVTSARKPLAAIWRTSPTRSSTCVRAGRTSTGGSISPVGRMTCSTKTPRASFISQWLGVAETATVCGRMASHSSKRSGRLSMQEGRRKPYSAKRRLAAEVAAEHAAELRDGDVTLVGEHQRVIGHIFEQVSAAARPACGR